MSKTIVELNADSEKQQTVSVDGLVSSTLLLKQTFSSTSEPLVYYLLKDTSTNVFFRLTGLLWIDDNSSILVNLIQCMWSSSIFCGLLLMIGFSLWDMIVCFSDYQIARFRVVYFLYGVTVFLQAFTLILSVIEIRKRLALPTCENETLFLTNALRISYFVLLTSLFIGLLTPAVYFYLNQDSTLQAVFLIGEVSICCVLTATMYFISTDCAVAMAQLDQLLVLAASQVLTFEQFSCVRSDIRNRGSKSSWIYNTIVIVALLDILCVVSAIFLDAYGNNILLYLIIYPLFLKELPFLAVVYWQVAKVNEKSARLTVELVEKPWDKPEADNQVRRDIFMSSVGSPIGFSLAGMALKRKDIFMQLGLWSIALFLSIVRSLISASV